MSYCTLQAFVFCEGIVKSDTQLCSSLLTEISGELLKCFNNAVIRLVELSYNICQYSSIQNITLSSLVKTDHVMQSCAGTTIVHNLIFTDSYWFKLITWGDSIRRRRATLFPWYHPTGGLMQILHFNWLTIAEGTVKVCLLDLSLKIWENV